MAGKGLAIPDVASYPALRGDAAAVMEVFQENLGGETITERDLDSIKMPSGGSQVWDIPSIDGGRADKFLEGVVLWHSMPRAYWATRQLTGQPPQCRSKNSRDAYGDPGDQLGNHGACLRCPMAQWGSAPPRDDGTPSNGQACKQMKQIFLLMEDSFLPRVLTLPPTSLDPAKKFFLGLANAGHAHYEVSIRIGLEQRKAGNTPYSVATFELAGALDDETKTAVASYREAILPMIQSREVTADDVQAAAA
jgi:hypothetical protein